jgi:hypothetical protein
VVLLARKDDPILPDADDGGDNPDAEPGAFKCLSLLDMGFDISDVPATLRGDARPLRKAGCQQRLAHRAIVGAIARRVDLLFGDVACKRAAAEKMTEMSFLVAP